MDRYSLKELLRMEVLPSNCNEEAEKYAMQFDSPDLLVAMRMMRERVITQGYGKITYLSSTGEPEALFIFRCGICERATPIHYVGDNGKVVIQGSVRFYKPIKEQENE